MKQEHFKIVGLLGPTFLAPIIVAGIVRLAARTQAAPHMTFINTFAAGLFLGIALFHIFPESVETYCDADTEAEFRNLFLSAAAGLVFMLFLDKVWLAGAEPPSSSLPDENDDKNAATSSWDLGPQDATACGIVVPASEWGNVPQIRKKIENFKTARSMVLSTYFAFCIHSVIAGIALGAAKPSRTIALVLILFTFHKSIDAIGVTTQLIKLKWNPFSYWLAVVVFSLATPAGIFAGIQFVAEAQTTVALVSCFSGGIFVYISLPHILLEELNSAYGTPFIKCLTYSSGIACALMTAMLE